jgi:4-amino-4-deoxy-L-arabinose transferase-like glycosyltransferase
MKPLLWLKENNYLILILLVGTILRCYHLDFQSVWLDEIHTLNEANPNLSLSDLFTSLAASDPHPPLYFIVLQILFKIFGYTTLVVRAFSAIMGIMGMVAIYLLAKELMNKKVALFSIALLAVNYFHIYYSQEARMYAMMFTTTVFSFYFLIRFIKTPTLKTAFLHGFFAVLMIYTHFFALFTLFSHYLILLFFIVKPYQQNGKKLFYLSFFSGITTLLLYLPSLRLFFVASERKSIWIPLPTIDVYTQIFKDFFGQSEIVLYFISFLIIFVFIKLFQQKNNSNTLLNPAKDKFIFSFFIVFIWVFITLLIPLISSFINLPMIINRYFISILPAIILLVGIGLYYIKNNLVRGLFLTVIVVFSLTDLIVVKKYYTQISKTQFREVSMFIINNNKTKEDVVTSLEWYFPFFMKNEKVNIIAKSLDEKVNEMILDTTKIKPFWYVDAHLRPFNPSEESKSFLDRNFVVDNSVSLYDAWTKYFIPKKQYQSLLDVNELITNQNEKQVHYSIEMFNEGVDKIELKGWAFFENQDSKNTSISILAIIDGKAQRIFSENEFRGDVTTYFKNNVDLSYSGFKSEFIKNKLSPGKYEIAILLTDNVSNKKKLQLTDKSFIVN